MLSKSFFRDGASHGPGTRFPVGVEKIALKTGGVEYVSSVSGGPRFGNEEARLERRSVSHRVGQ